jgi:hypothetical protein
MAPTLGRSVIVALPMHLLPEELQNWGGAADRRQPVATLVEQERAYPFYCVLLYTREPGLERELSDYIEAHLDELDQLFGEACLAIAIRPTRRKRPRVTRGAVYGLARELGLETSELPCAVFYASSEMVGKPVRLAFRDFLPPDRKDGDVTRAFRFITDAVARLESLPEDVRLNRLHRELKRAQRKCFPNGTRPGALRRMADASGDIDRTVSLWQKLVAMAIAVGGALR